MIPGRAQTCEALRAAADRLAASICELVVLARHDPGPGVSESAVVIGADDYLTILWAKVRRIERLPSPESLASTMRFINRLQSQADRLLSMLRGRKLARERYDICPGRRGGELRVVGTTAEVVARKIVRPTPSELDDSGRWPAVEAVKGGPAVLPRIVSTLTAAPLAPPRPFQGTKAA